MAGKPSTRSESRDSDIDDDEEDEDPTLGKPGRKKNPNSQAARRDQNRIAQREFRLRKQQRIRDLEARVELLSGNKEEIVYEMRMMLKDLMEENASLRTLVKGLSSFIGEGTGGLVHGMGWTNDEFNDFLSKTTSDSAYESFQKHKANAASKAKRRAPEASASTDNGVAGSSKRARTNTTSANYSNGSDFASFRSLTNGSAAASNAPETSLFSQLVRGAGQAMYVPPATPHGFGLSSSPTTYGPSVTGGSYMSPPSLEAPSPLLGHSSNQGHGNQQGYGPPPAAPHSEDVDPKVDEAGKLIHYHLENYSRNSSYHLPASLRPTDIQQKIPHNRFIDSVLIPGIRDHMILLQDKFDLAEALQEFMFAVTVHGEDVLSHTNWEISENWLSRYSMLINQTILDMTNRWRRDRGERELSLDALGPDGQRLRAIAMANAP